MDKITVLNVSHYKREPNLYHAKNEDGFGPDIYLFVFFIKPAVVTIDGTEQVVDSNACIIYTPGQRHEYRHHDGTFLNGFLIFKNEDQNLLKRYGLPENEIFYISNGDEVSFRLELISYSITDKLINRANETQSHVVRLFETLSRLSIDNNPKLKRSYTTRQRFLTLRKEIQENPKEWTVEKMAKHVWFSRSRFSVLYTEFMNISPSDDLINIKIEHAKHLLKTTNLAISDISANCGYSSVEHLIRVFKQKTNLTPLKYRKNNKSEG